MATLSLFKVTYRFVKAAAALTSGQTGSAYQYTRDPHTVILAAASAHPKDILSVLSSDITKPSGDTFEILQVSPVDAVGTEGNVVYS